jgi:hypothetical protein
MGFMETFLPANDRYAALLLYSMVFSLAFNGYDAGIMTVILADSQVRAVSSLSSATRTSR